MTPQKEHQSEHEVRVQILVAAEQRFRDFGYNKTTMAEIAKDCDMSAANLYRYFDNKLAIAASLACQCLSAEECRLKESVQANQQPAAEHIKQFVFETLHYTFKQCSETPRINEMVNAVCAERMDIVQEHMNTKKELLIAVIQKANNDGEFNVRNPEQAAEAILTSVTLFDAPMLMALFPLDILEKKAQGLVELILNGLNK